IPAALIASSCGLICVDSTDSEMNASGFSVTTLCAPAVIFCGSPWPSMYLKLQPSFLVASSISVLSSCSASEAPAVSSTVTDLCLTLIPDELAEGLDSELELPLLLLLLLPQAASTTATTA